MRSEPSHRGALRPGAGVLARAVLPAALALGLAGCDGIMAEMNLLPEIRELQEAYDREVPPAATQAEVEGFFAAHRIRWHQDKDFVPRDGVHTRYVGYADIDRPGVGVEISVGFDEAGRAVSHDVNGFGRWP